MRPADIEGFGPVGTNSSEPAFPFIVPDISKFQAHDPGLTKREYVAIAAMHGILSTETAEDSYTGKAVARRAVAFADALIAELTSTERSA